MSSLWTTEQSQAIESRGGSLLVSAAAGSGKTAVLVERVIERILDPHDPVDADRLLVVTFSNAAAEEIRRRVASKLRERLRENPDDKHILRQQMLLENAKISTIHAFCLELLREHFHLLGLPPDFRVGDEQELELLRSQAVQETINACYAADEGERFSALVELISTSRNDNKVEQTILRLYDFIRSHAFYEEWLDQKRNLYRPDIPVPQSVWGQVVLEYASDGVQYAAALTRHALELMQNDALMYEAYSAAFQQDLDALETLRGKLLQGDWDGVCAALGEYTPARIGQLRGYDNPAKKDYVQDCRKRVKNLMEDLRDKQFCATDAEHREDVADLAPKVEVLFEAVKAFGRRLNELKTAKKMVDFPDLEHLVIALLVERVGEEFCCTPIAKAFSQRIEEVLIDEFQDTNSAQDMIFRAVSRQEENLFLVGDVKQSIYRFRQAMPEIFLEKRRQSVPYDGKHYPARIILGKNFRSRDSVTNCINDLFTLLMSETVGEIDYNADEALVPGAEYPIAADMETELHIVDIADNDRTRAEADYVAVRVRELLDSALLVGRGEDRHPVRPGDICVLLRSPKNRMEHYLDALRARGVPVWGEAQSGFLSTEEISAAVALLRAVDNPLLDLPLAEAFCSPLFGFTADDLARVRLAAPRKPFYQAICASAAAGERSCAAFLEVLNDLRRMSASLSADRLIMRMYDLTRFPRIVQVMDYGEQRAGNLRLLIDYAREYERRGFKGLCGFVRFITRVTEQGGDLTPALVQSVGAVTVMSIHRSKGLEFPVVVLADLDKNFNRQDLYGNTLLHSQLGFACKRRDPRQLRQFSTVPMEAIRLESDRAMLSEELRILYVAMTRAKEKLILTAALKNPAKTLAGLRAPLEGDQLSPWQVRRGGSYFDWIAMALLHHPDGAPLREMMGDTTPVLSATGRFKVIVAVPPVAVAAVPVAVPLPAPDPAMVEEFAKSCAYRYPHPGDTLTPAKFSISQIAHSADEGFTHAGRPAFLSGEGMSAARRGTATHKFMQFADFNRAAQDAATELERLVEHGFFSKEEADAVNLTQVQGFFASPLAARLSGAREVLREFRFMAEAGRELLAPYTDLVEGEEKTVLQGIADCVFLEEDGAVVIDYKTDRVKTAQVLVQRYAPQLSLYGVLLGDYLQTPIKECWVYSFALEQGIRIV